ncbi:hypothetical protein [uncultured Maribacter sp.]|uniref:hypothetical protein n=1 Tax=uncultured Maribacter sp. TaxID=431308 RepID=UPI00262507EF|nr:hypothetical protein [uncultured Maribacter sp.]
MILLLQSCASTQHKSIKAWEKNEWQVVKVDKTEEPTWKIFKRNLKGTDFLEYKIEGDIQSSPEACLDAFKNDIHKLANGAEDKKYPTYTISEESEQSLTTYVIHNEPFPFRNTELSIRYMFHDEANGSKGVSWKESWDDSYIFSSKKLKRVETFRGSWSFTPITENSSYAYNSVQFDPKGMPLWLVTPMVSKFLKQGLEDIRTTSK